MKRVLILLSDTGAGHRAAARAIHDALLMTHREEVQVRFVDVFRHYPFPFNKAPDVYPWWVNTVPETWGLTFHMFNTQWRASAFSSGMYKYAESQLKRMFIENPADVVVSVHSIITRSSFKALASLDAPRPPFVTVVTDLVSTHMFWYEPRVERCLVPTRRAYERGLQAGLTPDQLRLTGLPVSPKFVANMPDKASAREQLGWHPTLPAVLLVSGGEGMGPLYQIARSINERRLNCQLAIIAGHNRSLPERLQAASWNQPTHIYGYVNNMPVLMAGADVLVSKAGPATISEACIAGLPMVLFDAIPGQETGNLNHVREHQIGVYAPTPQQVGEHVMAWLSDPDELAQRSQLARNAATPNAVWDIAEEIWRQAHQPATPTQSRSLRERISRQLSLS